MLKRARRVLLLLIVMALALGGLLWWLSWSDPAWWNPPDPQDRQVVAEADRFEWGLVEQAHQIRTARDTWSVTLADGQVNQWLSARLPEWIAHEGELEWPDRLGTPQVRFDPQGIHVAVEIREHGRSRVVTAHVVPSMTADGRLEVAVDQVALGRLHMPGAPVATIVRRLSEAAPEPFLTDPVVEATRHLLFEGTVVDPALSLADGRTVRLERLKCRDGELTLWCRTSPADAGVAGGPATAPHDGGAAATGRAADESLNADGRSHDAPIGR